MHAYARHWCFWVYTAHKLWCYRFASTAPMAWGIAQFEAINGQHAASLKGEVTGSSAWEGAGRARCFEVAALLPFGTASC